MVNNQMHATFVLLFLSGIHCYYTFLIGEKENQETCSFLSISVNVDAKSIYKYILINEVLFRNSLSLCLCFCVCELQYYNEIPEKGYVVLIMNNIAASGKLG